MKWKINKEATGLLIKQRCVESGLTPKYISEVLGVTLTVPYLWFTGKAVPQIEHLVALKNMLNCTIEDLLVIEEVEDGQ